jgi:ring-1,2-phenylacetyl-CoA epoxidase subunit PaaE
MPTGFYSIPISQINPETDNAVSITLEVPPLMAPLFSYKSGQYLTLCATINNEEIRRSYSMCSSPSSGEKITIAVKKVDGGRMSNYLNSELNVGDTIDVMPPLGSFILNDEVKKSKNLVFWGGGSGITPLLSIIKTALFELPESKCLLVYANRDEDNVIFKSELDSLLNEHAQRFSIIYSLDKPKTDWQGRTGFITQETVSEITRSMLGLNYPTAHYYTCGPGAMMDIVVESLKAIGIRDDNIHTEYFTATKQKETNAMEQSVESQEGTDRTIKVEVFGQQKEVIVKFDQTILDATQDAGLDPPYSCTVGVCTTCRARLKSGKVRMDEREGLSDAEIEEGFVLTCQAHPLSNDVDLVFE